MITVRIHYDEFIFGDPSAITKKLRDAGFPEVNNPLTGYVTRSIDYPRNEVVLEYIERCNRCGAWLREGNEHKSTCSLINKF
jgi:hypothetical protein